MAIRNAFAATSLALLSLWTLAPVQAAQPGVVVVQPNQPVYGQGRPVYLPAPPPPRREAKPRARRGQVWVAGHWQWQGRRHVWAPGHWVQARPGHRYRQPQWVQQRNGQWKMRGGGWDRDRDGVPNRHDRRPDNPYRH